MDKKLIGIVCACICMVSVVVFFILNFFTGWGTSWIVFVVAGIACAMVSMIGGYLNEKKNGPIDDDNN